MPARPHQIAARNAVIDSYDDGCTSQIVNMATGTGKTYLFSDLYEHLKSRLPGKMLVLAHTEELVDQNIKTLQEVNPTLRVDKEMAKHKADPSKADVIVASVASLGRKGTSRVLKYNWDEWDKVIVDEAHHTPVDFYRSILGVSGVLRPGSHKLLLGVTATTQRTDGKALADYYSKISYVYSLRQAIEDGQLVDVKGYRIDTATKIDDVASANGDFKANDLSDRINNPERNLNIVEGWKQLAADRKTILFAASVSHAKALAGEFTSEGVAATAIWGNDPDRKEKLRLYKEGKIKVLCNFGVLIEGFDDPGTSCIVIARPTKSPTLFTQMCGRGTRLAEGKTDCLILDVVDMSADHSLCTVPTLLGLSSNLDLCGQSLVKTAKRLEDIQEEYPTIDLMKLKKITDLKQFIETINLFSVNFPPEVEENSDFKWCKAVDGGYRMTVPRDIWKEHPSGYIKIYQNMLDKWEIEGSIRGKQIHGLRPTMEEAFAAADNAIRARAVGSVHLLDRKSSWNTNPASDAQLGLLKKLYPYKPFPADLTKGQAAHWIDQRIGKKG